LTANGATFPEFAELRFDARQPLVQHVRRPGVQRRERADDAGLALRNDEFGPGNDEHRRADDGQGKGILQQDRQRHS
jgi:hypothetical protein